MPAFVEPARILREQVYSPLAMLVTATAIGLFVRVCGSGKTAAAWSFGFGFSFTAIWLTREETAWIAPFVAAMIAATSFCIWRAPERWRRLPFCVLPFVMWGSAILGNCWMNLRHYGVFTRLELTGHDYTAAYGAVTRVRPLHEQGYIRPISNGVIVAPKETRERIYAVSSAFSELKPFLEGGVGQMWSGYGCKSFPNACENRDISSGWFLWALRDAVDNAGYKTGPSAAAYYRRLAGEINRACDVGKLSCEKERSSLAPVWRNYYLGPTLAALVRSASFITSAEDGATHTPSWGSLPGLPAHSDGDPELVSMMRAVSHEQITPEMSASSRLTRRVRGWAFDDSSALSLSIRTHSGQLADAHITIVSRPDVLQFYAKSRLTMPTAIDAGFDILTPCVTGCALYVRRGTQVGASWIKAMAIDGPSKIFDSGRMMIRIDDNRIVDPGNSTGRPPVFDNFLPRTQHALMAADLKLFCWIIRPLSILAFVILIFALWTVFRNRRGWIPGVILVSAAGVVLSRVAVIAVVSAMAFDVSTDVHYLGCAYPLLVLFIATSMTALSDLVQAWRPIRAATTSSRRVHQI
jgi:hypothetical protein